MTKKPQSSTIALMLAGVCGMLVGLILPTPAIDTIDSSTAATLVRTALGRIKDPAAQSIFEAARSKLPGHVEAIDAGRMVYVSADGRYLIRGEVWDTSAGKSLSAETIDAGRAKAISAIDPDDTITFRAAEEKATVTVFTDPDCPYCRQFHAHIDAINAAGITVHYLPFPLDMHAEAARKSTAIWCADDRKATFTAALSGIDPGIADCPNSVERSTRLAITTGIRGTPGVVAADGSMVSPGLASEPERFIEELLKRDRG